MDRHRHLKRLKHSTNTSDSRTRFPSDEARRQSDERFSLSCNEQTKTFRPVNPAPHRARRGGGRGQGRKWLPSGSLPKRAINYDLAESFMDHSSNPLSSDLYKIRFKHSAKQWPNGRFAYRLEKPSKPDGSTIEITCTRTFPLVPKRKKMEQPIEPKTVNPAPLIVVADPIAQEQKKKLADKQTNFYANLFGCAKIPRLSATTPMKNTH